MEIKFITKDSIGYEVRLSEELSELPEAAEIRKTVFIDEQGFENEFDEIDSRALHCLILYNGTAAAAGRLYRGEGSGEAHIGRIAAAKEFRGKGIGSLVMETLEEAARGRGYSEVSLSAQCRAENFYRSNGYSPVGGIYYDEFCPHIKMIKKL